MRENLQLLRSYIVEQINDRQITQELGSHVLVALGHQDHPTRVHEHLTEIFNNYSEATKIRDYWNQLVYPKFKFFDGEVQPVQIFQSSEPYVERIPQGLMGSVSYVVLCKGEGFVIDPGSRFKKIWSVIEKSGVRIKYIIITHGHIDHMLSMEELKQATGAKIVMHEYDKWAMTKQVFKESFFIKYRQTYSAVDFDLQDGDSLEVGGQNLQIIHTPGHTRGSICVRMNQTLFSGDMLFQDNDPFVDPQRGSSYDLAQSYTKVYDCMGGNFMVYPGHGKPVFIDREAGK